MAKKELTPEIKKTSLIVTPRLTEKASLQGDHNAYTFVVANETTKLSLAKEIAETYKVTPRKITITNVKGKAVFVRGKWGTTSSFKKAVVFLKKGDTIKLA